MTISSTVGRCRNCGDTEHLRELGFIGAVAPFFAKRVMGIKVGPAHSYRPWKRLVQRAMWAPLALFKKIYSPIALVEMQMCENCLFIQTKLPFHEDAINRLYLDYREETYNRERIEYEPSYAGIAADVGNATLELEVRLTAATKFLKNHVPVGEGFTILDFGGSDGKFMPRLDGQKFVFEISAVEPVAGVTRIHSGSELGTYSLVQLAHVVEHVVEPLELVKYVATKVAPGGFLYIETPQEVANVDRERVRSGELRLQIHEHINSFCVESVSKLIESAGLRLVAIEATPVDVGWATAVHLRALGQKS